MLEITHRTDSSFPETKNPRWLIVSRGLPGGWCAQAPDIRLSGHYGQPEELFQQALPGALVYDAYDLAPAGAEAFSDLVIRGPMPSANIEPNEVKKFNDHEAMTFMLPALEGEYKQIALMGLCGFSSFDYVGISVYEKLLESVPGMKIGRINQNGQVEWKSEKSKPIESST